MPTDRFAHSISTALRHPGVIALIVAGLTIAAMLIVDHGPWSRAKIQPAHVAMYHTTGEAARAEATMGHHSELPEPEHVRAAGTLGVDRVAQLLHGRAVGRQP